MKLDPSTPCVASGNQSLDAVVKFIACGDLSGFDSDKVHPLAPASQQAPLSPVQQPIHPPYEAAGLLKRKHVAEKLPEVTSETLQAEHVVTGTVTL